MAVRPAAWRSRSEGAGRGAPAARPPAGPVEDAALVPVVRDEQAPTAGPIPAFPDPPASAGAGVVGRLLARTSGPPSGVGVVSRRVAAELGMYVGAALVLLALGSTMLRGWSWWSGTVRWATVVLSAVGLLAAGLHARLPWSRVPSGQRRRAVSALLTCGATTALVAAAVWLAQHLDADRWPWLALAGTAALGAAAIGLAARTPLSDSALLAALVWLVWVATPAGPVAWLAQVALGAVWVVAGARFAAGRRTSAVLGAGLALLASVALASGAWGWPARGGLAVVVAVALTLFLRGGANHWLALGAGAATALAAAVAGDVLGPVLALLVGGLATMLVSWLALRSAPPGP